MTSNQQSLNLLQKQVSFLLEAFTKCMGISIDDDIIRSAQPELKNKSFTIELSDKIKDIESFEVILDTLNQFGNERGYSFKKGTSKQKKGEPATEKTIVCKYKDRNKDKHKDESSEINQNDKKLIKYVDCDAKYRFQVKNEKVILIDCKEEHNHGPNFHFQKTLSNQMLEEIRNFNKFSKPSEVREFLESKYGRKLDYLVVYNEFRRIFPRFGSLDCQNFIDYLEENGAFWKSSLDVEDLNSRDGQLQTERIEDVQNLCKLFFSTRRMKENLKVFGDVILIDTTYNINYYSTPLVVISGVDNQYQNILFGLSFINNEQQSTYSWILSQFKIIMHREPTVIYSDGDLALSSAISKIFPNVEHRLCSWHVARNFSRKFGFLSQENDDLKKKIVNLPYLYSKERFEEDVNEITKFLKEQELKNSESYLSNVLQKKTQWARSFHNTVFDADIITTSRVESWNAAIKTYLNSRSEISDVIKFIDTIEEKCSFSKKPLLSKAMYSLLEYDPLLKGLKAVLPVKIYDKVIIQYNLGKRDYERKLISQEEGRSVFEVTFQNRANEEDLIENEVDLASPATKYIVKCEEKVTCNCNYFKTTGLICRHEFFICFCENVKDVNKLVISKRWSFSFEQVEKHFIKLPEKKLPIAFEEKKEIKEEDSLNMEISQNKEEKIEESDKKLERDGVGNASDNENEESHSSKKEKELSQSPIKNFKKVVVKKGAPRKGNLIL